MRQTGSRRSLAACLWRDGIEPWSLVLLAAIVISGIEHESFRDENNEKL
jgi:hypothetical protein